MWKSGISPREAALFSPQAGVENFRVFHRGCGREKCVEIFHRPAFHNPQPLWKISEKKESGREKIRNREISIFGSKSDL